MEGLAKINLSSVEKIAIDKKNDIVNMNNLEVNVDLDNDYNSNENVYDKDLYVNDIVSNEEVVNNTVNDVSFNNLINLDDEVEKEVNNGLEDQIITPVTLINNSNVINDEDGKYSLEDLTPPVQEKVIPNVVSTGDVFNNILNNTLPYIHNEVKEEVVSTNNYTLNDYRLFNKILKEIKEHNNNNTVTINKDLEYRLITKYSTETYNMFKDMLKIYSN